MTVPEDFCWTWGALREFNTEFLCQPGEVIHYTRSKMSLHAGARNFLGEARRGQWLFMVDTDVMLEPDALYKMLALMHKYQTPVLTGVVRHKALPHHPLLWHWSETDDGFIPIVEYDKNVQVFRVDAMGAGCLLIANTVFDRLAQAFPDEGPFDHIGKYGEDFSFALRCKKLSIPIYATPLVEAIHLMVRGVTESEYMPDWWESQAIEVVCGREGPQA